MHQTIHSLDTESTIRNVMRGLCEENPDKGVYVGFDMRITTQEGNYEQRDVALGVHLLRYNHLVIGCVNRDFIFPKFDPSIDWDYVSSHSSCWADSSMHFIDRIVKTVMKEKSHNKFVRRDYKDDKLVFDENNYSVNIRIGRISLIGMEDLKKVKYNNRDNGAKQDLIFQWKHT